MIPVEFQYFRDGERRPVVTVCYVRCYHRTYIGIAVCSPKDTPCKVIGKRIAVSRARKALSLDRDCGINTGSSLGDGPYRVQQYTDMVAPLWTRYMVVHQPDYRMGRRKMSKLLPRPDVDIEQLYQQYTQRLVKFRNMVDEMARGLLD
jgi:hypothetical protein